MRILLPALALIFASALALAEHPPASAPSPAAQQTSITLSAAPSPSTFPTSATLNIAALLQEEPAANNYDVLKNELKRIVREQAIDASRLGIFVQDCRFPITVLDFNSEMGFMPGSTQKLVTTAAALDALGPNYTFKTMLELSGSLAKEEALGSLYIRGSGDPTLGSAYVDPNLPHNPTALFHEWAKKIKASGIRRIHGSIIADDDYFDHQTELAGWPLQDRGVWYMSQITALMVNDNCIDVLFQGAKRTGKPAMAFVTPKTDYVVFHNGVMTGAKDEPPRVTLRRVEESNLINADGTVPLKAQYPNRATVQNPSLYFARLLRETLIREGVQVSGNAYAIGDIKNTSALTTDTWPVHVQVSPPLSEITHLANSYGGNTYGDMLLKTLGKVRYQEGSFSAGIQALQDFLRRIQVDDNDIVMTDGAGLAIGNSLSPRFVAQFLARMSREPNAQVFLQSLGQPGRRGLLQNRFAAARQANPALAERIHAVFGVMSANYSFSGYATTEGGAQFAFSFMINDPRYDYAQACALLDSLTLAVANAGIRVNSDGEAPSPQ